MDTDKVIQLVYNVSHSCQFRETRWEELLQNIHVTRVQVVFASTEAFLSTTLELQETLRSKLKIPSFFFDRMYLQSSSFCGYDVWLDKNEEVEFYTYWARFTVKQTYDKLQPKRTFTPHISNHHNNPSEWNTDIAIHGPQSVRHG